MTNADGIVFAERLTIIGELFDAQLTEAKIALYFGALKDLSLDVVLDALNEAVRCNTFMPKPAELRALTQGSLEDHIERAWMAFKTAARHIGAYRSLATEQPALGHAIAAVFGSWPDACTVELSPEMWTAKRKEFGRVYRAIADRADRGVCYLPGLCDVHNRGIQEWQSYVPVGVIDAQGQTRMLEGADAQAYRQRLAATPETPRLAPGL